MKGTDHNPAAPPVSPLQGMGGFCSIPGDKPMSVAVLGIGGYGQVYVSALLDEGAAHGLRFIAAADPNPSTCKRIEEVRGAGVRIYSTADQLFAEEKPDLVVICTPIMHHSNHIVQAMAHGAHVLCEKPMCATVDQGKRIIEAAQRFRRHAAIGFQWSYGKATHLLKHDVLTGVLGKPVRMRTLVLWPRDERYYSRNQWAGRIKDDQGHFVYDSPINNACAHFLHNMLYVLGSAPDRSATPLVVRSELYRAKRIDNFDLGCVQVGLRDGVELMLIATHASRTMAGPLFEYEFEKAVVSYDELGSGEFVARFHDGRVKSYGKPPEANETAKLWRTADAIRAGESSLCSPESALSQIVVNLAAQQAGEIIDISEDHLMFEGAPGERSIWIRGVDAVLMRCYREYKMPSELGLDWAVHGGEIRVNPDLSFKTQSDALATADL